MAGCILHQQLQDYGISSADPRDGMIAAASIFLGIQLLCSDAFAIMTAIQLQLELSYAETCISTSGTVSHTIAVSQVHHQSAYATYAYARSNEAVTTSRVL